MKVGEFRGVLKAAERLYLDGGDAMAAELPSTMSTLFAGRETTTMSAFTALIAKVTRAENSRG